MYHCSARSRAENNGQILAFAFQYLRDRARYADFTVKHENLSTPSRYTGIRFLQGGAERRTQEGL